MTDKELYEAQAVKKRIDGLKDMIEALEKSGNKCWELRYHSRYDSVGYEHLKLDNDLMKTLIKAFKEDLKKAEEKFERL